MLARTAQAPAWSKQASACQACRRQWQIIPQRRWTSQHIAAAAISDSWIDTLNDISDEYTSHKPESHKTEPAGLPKIGGENESTRKSRRARQEVSQWTRCGAMSIKSLQDALDATIPPPASEGSADPLTTHKAKHSDFEAAFLSGQSRHRDRRKHNVAATPTVPHAHGVVQTNDVVLANLLDGLKADAKIMAVQQDEDCVQPQEEKMEPETISHEDTRPVPFPSFRGRSKAGDNIDVPAGRTIKATATQITTQPTTWKAKTSPAKSGLGGPIVARIGSDRPMSLLDHHRGTLSKKPWGANDERASSVPPKVTFRTLSQSDWTSPKKATKGSVVTKRPFGFVDRVKTLWRGPARPTDPEDAQEHASPGAARVSRNPEHADDMEDLLSRLATRNATKSSAPAETAPEENAPRSINPTYRGLQHTTEQRRSGEQHTIDQPVDVTHGLHDHADRLTTDRRATDSLVKLHATYLQHNEERASEIAKSSLDHSSASQQRDFPTEEKHLPVELVRPHEKLHEPKARRSRRNQLPRRIRKVMPSASHDAQSAHVSSKEHNPKPSPSGVASISRGPVANVTPSDHAQSRSVSANVTEEVSMEKSSEEHSKKAAGEAVDFSGSATAHITSASAGRASVSLAEAMKGASRSKLPRKQSVGKVKESTVKGQAMPATSKLALDNDMADQPEAVEHNQTKAAEQSHVDVLSAQLSELKIQPVNIPQPPVPYLEYGLSRVLFNPGVYQLQDMVSRVYNFDPYLQKIMPIEQFDFNALKEYKTSSQDTALATIAKQQERRYIGSTSSMTSSLAHFHYLISNWRPLNLDMLSRGYVGKHTRSDYTKINKAPSAIFLRWKNGCYAIDADKEFDSANVLMLLGKSMELLLTLPKDEYEKYRKSNPRMVSEEQRTAPESYQYTTMGDFLMRSQLDAYDPRLPGNGTFDLKTRAVVTIRMSAHDHEKMTGYEIYGNQGRWSSYEKEYHDMARATMLKYMLQARMGRMNGIFVAYHNVKRIFGFQYIPIADMDLVLHGQSDTSLGDQEFKASLKMMNDLLNKATSKYPEQSLRIHFETQTSGDAEVPTCLHMFAEPMSEQEIDQIQSKQKDKIAAYERKIMGKEDTSDGGTSKEADKDSETFLAQCTESQDRTSDYARQQLSYRSTDTPANQPFLSQVQETQTVETKPLFYATAIVQSEVNGSVQNERPENLKKEDDWRLNYLIKDYEVSRHHWALYDDMKARRRQALHFEWEEADEADGEADGKSRTERDFIAFLENMSKKGEAVREKQDLADQESGSSVIQVDEPLPRVRERVETLEDYIQWMYTKEQE